MTNLRLPGQYDERLFASVGLQGPYYNWNRWYLPGVGRYLELDPIALSGEFNRDFGVDWYAYALGNPMRYVDPLGLEPGPGDSVPPEGPQKTQCVSRCLAQDPLFQYMVPLSLVPLVNLKTPWDLRQSTSSWWTTLDRRLPNWCGANPDKGALVRLSGNVGRAKYLGRYGTAAVAVGTFATSYSATAMVRCYVECGQ